MHPHVFGTIDSYSVFLALSVAVGVMVGVYRLHRAGLALGRCVELELLLAGAGLVGAKVYAIAQRGYVLPLADELTSGLRYPGAILGTALGLLVARRWLLRGVALAPLADAIAPAAGLAAAIGRLGCFAHGCCFGIETAHAWGVRFPAQSPAWHAHVAARAIVSASPFSLPVHPLQLYFAATSAAIALFAMWYCQRATYAGQAALVFLAFDGVTKALLESMRAEPHFSLQMTAALASLVGMVVLFNRCRRDPWFLGSSAVSRIRQSRSRDPSGKLEPPRQMDSRLLRGNDRVTD